MKVHLKLTLTLLLLFMVARLPGQQVLSDADMAILKRDYTEALKICNSLAKSGDESAALYMRLGIIHASLSDHTRALTYLTKAETGGGKSISSGLLIAECYEAIGDLEAASAKYEEVIYADRSNIFPVINFSKMLLSNRMFNEAVKWCQLLVDTLPGNPVFRKNLGGCFLQLGMDSQALQNLYEAWKLNNKDISVLSAMTTAWLRLEIPGNGIKTLTDATEIHPDSPLLYKCIGNLYFALQNYDSSSVAYQTAYNLGDTSDYIVRQIGFSYYATSEFRKAIPFLYENYINDTLNYESVQYLGLALANASRQREAIPYLETAITLLRPDSAVIGSLYATIGRAAYEINNIRTGIESYNAALRYLPDDPDCIFELARVYDQAKNYKEALKYYEKYLSYQDTKIKELAESKNIDPAKISFGGRHSLAKQRVKLINEKLFFQGEIKRSNS
jgi:tetratricopeptide (TPR) repeat protein